MASKMNTMTTGANIATNDRMACHLFSIWFLPVIFSLRGRVSLLNTASWNNIQ